jgi:hypothetical protein
MNDWYENDLGFALLTAVIIVAAHAIAFFAHEFAHSFTAWALGYMPHPLALDYGELTPANVVLMLNVGDNVQYDSIMSAGHGHSAAVIALAGSFIGNGVLYCCVSAAVQRARNPGVVSTLVAFWLMMMCAGNVWSYVPIRAITTHADVAIAASGLGLSVWVLFPILLVPSLLLVGHFFLKTCSSMIPAMTRGQSSRTVTVIGLTVAWFFMFFGIAGLLGDYGAVSQAFSVISVVVLMPVTFGWLWPRCVKAIW